MKKGTKFIYYSHQTLQVPRVARQCMVGLCEGAAALGAESEIVSFTVRMHESEPLHPPFEQLYGLEHPVRNTSFRLIGVRVDDNSAWFRIQRLALFGAHFLRFCLREESRRFERVVVSARNYAILLLLASIKRLLLPSARLVADVHGFPPSLLARWAHRFADGNVCVSRALVEDLRGELSLPGDKLSVAHTGVKRERFSPPAAPKEELRRRLHLPPEVPIVCYSGKVFYRYPEIGYYLEAARIVGARAHFVIVGGREDQVVRWEEERRREGIANLSFRSFQPAGKVVEYLNAADLLVMYYSPEKLNKYRSPGKLFEYLASGTPVIASRFAGIEEVIRDGENGYLIEPYRPELLAEKILELVPVADCAAEIGRNALRTAEYYSWERRAAAFLSDGVESLPARGSGVPGAHAE